MLSFHPQAGYVLSVIESSGRQNGLQRFGLAEAKSEVENFVDPQGL